MRTKLDDQFPNCRIHYMQQRSPAWYDIKRGKLSASTVGAWLTEQPQCRMTVAEIKDELDKLGVDYAKSAKRDDLLAMLPPEMHVMSLTQTTEQAWEKAICKALGGLSNHRGPEPMGIDPDGPEPENLGQWAIWNGIRLEPEAEAAFTLGTDLKLAKVGFCEHVSGLLGCSPDGLIVGHPEGFEGKCPLPETHVRYYRSGNLPDEYRDQVHFSMAVTGAQAWWFQSYVPDMPPFRIRVERDDYTEQMAAGIERLVGDIEQAKMKLQRDIKRGIL